MKALTRLEVLGANKLEKRAEGPAKEVQMGILRIERSRGLVQTRSTHTKAVHTQPHDVMHMQNDPHIVLPAACHMADVASE